MEELCRRYEEWAGLITTGYEERVSYYGLWGSNYYGEIEI